MCIKHHNLFWVLFSLTMFQKVSIESDYFDEVNDLIAEILIK